MAKIKIWILAVFCLLLSGCTSQDGEAVVKNFSLSDTQEEAFRAAIEETMNSLYWWYDGQSVLFTEQATPQKTEKNAEAIFEASEKSGYDLRKYAGKTAVLATADMVHFNGDAAGTAYFYFYRDKLAGLYYKAQGDTENYYAMTSRNVYIGDGAFSQYESDKGMAEYTASAAALPAEGFHTIGKTAGGDTAVAVVEQDRVLVYRYQNRLTLYRTIRFPGKVAISASFYEDAAGASNLAVIFGTEIVEGEGEGESHFSVSEILRCYDQNFNPIQDIELSAAGYSCAAADGEGLLLMNDTILERFVKQDGVFQKEKQFFLGHGATAIRRTDLDGDGQWEYLMTDGMDLYLYRNQGANFVCLWKTHLGIENFDRRIYVGDLNQDGVKEIYIADTTGTTVRYVVGEDGLVSRNEDISYGQRYFAGDFNRDGKDDYILIGDIENTTQELYLAK